MIQRIFNIYQSHFFKKYNASENVVAFIKGKEKPEEVVIISALRPFRRN